MKTNQLKEYTIDNGIIKLRALNYGACITGIEVCDRNGKRENVVASFADQHDFVNNSGPYLNAAVGPYAGRVAYGTYVMENEIKHLSINAGKHHLHGGNSGISMQYFTVQEARNALHFHLETTHEKDGYPKGLYDYDIEYRLEADTLCITLHATPPAKSLLSMTNHLYFNLSGDDQENIMRHQLRIGAHQRGRIHADGHPCEITQDDAYDFRSLSFLEDRFAIDDPERRLTNGYDTPFLLDGSGITLWHESSGRCMDITSDAAAAVVYSANAFDESLCFEHGKKGSPYSYLAIELQRMPNEINLKQDHTAYFFTPDYPFHQETHYRFTCR